jgi:hypothetical protein
MPIIKRQNAALVGLKPPPPPRQTVIKAENVVMETSPDYLLRRAGFMRFMAGKRIER